MCPTDDGCYAYHKCADCGKSFQSKNGSARCNPCQRELINRPLNSILFSINKEIAYWVDQDEYYDRKNSDFHTISQKIEKHLHTQEKDRAAFQLNSSDLISISNALSLAQQHYELLTKSEIWASQLQAVSSIANNKKIKNPRDRLKYIRGVLGITPPTDHRPHKRTPMEEYGIVVEYTWLKNGPIRGLEERSQIVLTNYIVNEYPDLKTPQKDGWIVLTKMAKKHGFESLDSLRQMLKRHGVKGLPDNR